MGNQCVSASRETETYPISKLVKFINNRASVIFTIERTVTKALNIVEVLFSYLFYPCSYRPLQGNDEFLYTTEKQNSRFCQTKQDMVNNNPFDCAPKCIPFDLIVLQKVFLQIVLQKAILLMQNQKEYCQHNHTLLNST